jgi:Ca-activated chloride channel family protein
MSFANPLWFLALLPLGTLAVYIWWQGHRRHASLSFSSLRLYERVPVGMRARLVQLPWFLLVAAVVLMIFALARPQLADTKIKRFVEGIDIMIALDISDSMGIEDMRPVNRMESAKVTIEEFIKTRTSDRIGLLVFSGEAYTRVPLSLDYPLLLKTLKETKPSPNLKMGTAIGVALASASGRLKDSTAKSRVVILLTDGENNSGTIDPETALDIAKGYGIRVYSIGVGQDGQAQLPVMGRDAFGNPVKRYQPIHSSVNDALLGKMASETGGKYFRAIDTSALKRTFSSISSLEKTKIETNQFTRYTELYHYPLMASVGLWGIALVLMALGLRRWP